MNGGLVWELLDCDGVQGFGDGVGFGFGNEVVVVGGWREDEEADVTEEVVVAICG